MNVKIKQAIFEAVVGSNVKDCLCDTYDGFIAEGLDKAQLETNGIVFTIVRIQSTPIPTRK